MLACSCCTKEFKYESEKKRHELSHSPQFECKDCSKKFSFVSALRRHQKQHSRTASVQCAECSRNFKDGTLLLRHIKYAHKGTHICSQCNATYNSEIALSNHLKTHKPKSEWKFKCQYLGCKKTFNFAHHLKYHELTHSKSKEYFCNACGKGFTQVHHLKLHLKSHEPENYIPCKIPNCKKTFPTHAALKRHLNIHVTVLCPFCGKLLSLATFDKHVAKCLKPKHEQPEDLSTITKSNSEALPINEDIDSREGLEDWDVIGDTPGLLCHGHIENLNYFENSDFKSNDSFEISSKLGYVDLSKTNTLTKKCDDCSCVSNKICKSENGIKKIITEDFPDLEYKIDGTIKLKDTYDLDIKVELPKKENLENNNNSKNIYVPFNSCKDVLGKCIVSGNGTISEECLCAKMAMNDQMIAQEIDEITPKPLLT